jgi:hypothetical protein
VFSDCEKVVYLEKKAKVIARPDTIGTEMPHCRINGRTPQTSDGGAFEFYLSSPFSSNTNLYGDANLHG